jgi:hypothetical protein
MQVNNMPQKDVPANVELAMISGNTKITLTKNSDGTWNFNAEK